MRNLKYPDTHFLDGDIGSNFKRENKYKSMKLIILLSIVAVLVVSGCTSTNVLLCEADYVKVAEMSGVSTPSIDDMKDTCKTDCYTGYETTSYKMVRTTKTMPVGELTYDVYTCYCDVNKCGGKIVEEVVCGDDNLCPDDSSEDEAGTMLEKCVRSKIVIKRADYNSTAQTLTLMLYNAGTVPLTGFMVQVALETNETATWYIDPTLSSNSFGTYTHVLPDESIDYIEVRAVECQGAYDIIRGYDVVY